MSGFGSRYASASEGPTRARGRSALVVAAAVAIALLSLPATAQAYRRGLSSSIGGATLGSGHALYLLAGYPQAGLGWWVALAPWVDLGLSASVLYGSPVRLGDPLVGGGGGLQARFALLRGRVSAAVTLRAEAIAYPAFGTTVAMLDLGSPSLELSLRLSDRLALHAAVGVAFTYFTNPESLDFVTGFEARGGLTFGLTDRLALIATASYGASLITAFSQPAGARLEVLLGLEMRLGGPRRAPSTE